MQSEVRRRTAASPTHVVPSSDFLVPLHLWRGEWWRITVSGFHHAGLVHLLSNCLVLVIFGFILERRVGSAPYLVFFLVATTVSLIPCFLLNTITVGLSGGICAVFGLMVVVRDHDEELNWLLPKSVFVVGLIGLFVSFPTNAFGWTNFSNWAHFTGLIFGWLAGWAWYADTRIRRFGRWFFVAGSLLIVPSLYLATHPIWRSDYQRTLAWETEDHEERVKHLEEAARLDPMWFDVWIDLEEVHSRNGDTKKAWRAAISGFYHSRSDLRRFARAWRIHQNFITEPERIEALVIFREVFGKESQTWAEHLGLLKTSPQTQTRNQPVGVNLFWDHVDETMTLKGRRLRVPEIDPDDARSALLGRSM